MEARIDTQLAGLVIAALGGAAVGLERQWSGHATGPAPRFAGIRTFTMLGALAGLSGWLWTEGAAPLAVALLGGAIAITVIAYLAASRQDVEGTTEVAALIVLAAGVMAGMGMLRLASGIVAVQILLLVEKTRLHAIVRRIDDVDLRAGVRFAVMALVILPLLPQGPFGPFDSIRPRELWMLVLFFSGLSFVGHLLGRGLGAGHGYVVSGLAGGLMSSTNVTVTFARLSRHDASRGRDLGLGAVCANAVLYPRVLAATAVLNAALVPSLALLLAGPALVTAGAAVLAGRRSPRAAEADASTPPQSNPLQLTAALQMAVLFQIVLVAVHAARAVWGEAGVVTTAAVLGLTDVDALTMSMARGAARQGTTDLGALAIAVGVLANTGLKAGVALVLGSSHFRTLVGGTLVAAGAAGAAAILLLRAGS